MKKMIGIALLLALVASGNTSIAASFSEKKPNIQEGTQVIQHDGYIEIVTTKLFKGDIEQQISNLEKAGVEVHKAQTNFSAQESDKFTALDMTPASKYSQNDYFNGTGKSRDAVSGQTGYIYCFNGHIGLNAYSGHIDARLATTSAKENRSRMVLGTWGGGGGWLIYKEYVFQASGFVSGTSSYTINSDLTGAIAYYSVSVYGDHKNPPTNSEWSSEADLVEP